MNLAGQRRLRSASTNSSLPADLANFIGDRLRPFAILARVNQTIGSGGSQFQRNCSADAARRTGDDGRLAREFVHLTTSNFGAGAAVDFGIDRRRIDRFEKRQDLRIVRMIAEDTEFLDRFVGRPALLRHPIGCDHRAGAVGAVGAMDENRLILRIANNLEKLDGFLSFQMEWVARNLGVLQSSALRAAIDRYAPLAD